MICKEEICKFVSFFYILEYIFCIKLTVRLHKGLLLFYLIVNTLTPYFNLFMAFSIIIREWFFHHTFGRSADSIADILMGT